MSSNTNRRKFDSWADNEANKTYTYHPMDYAIGNAEDPMRKLAKLEVAGNPYATQMPPDRQMQIDSDGAPSGSNSKPSGSSNYVPALVLILLLGFYFYGA